MSDVVPAVAPASPAAGRVIPVREVYFPAHLGNFYEVALPDEMRDLLAEARHWGFNRYSDWFNAMDLYDPYHKDHRLYNMPEAMWERKLTNYAIAQAMGFPLATYVTPNHVFNNQVTAANIATKARTIFGQLVCPSKPGVQELILDNHRTLFGDLARRGIRLQALNAAAYDYGGCDCEACRPWIVTFGKLCVRIAALAREIFGHIELCLNGWWWTAQEHQQFSDWADREAPGQFRSLAYHLPYGVTAYEPKALPKGTATRAFVHTSYGMTRRDTYGHYGPTIAPARIEATVRHLQASGADGFIAYTEGPYDDINRAVLAGIASGRCDNAQQVLTEYARRHLGDSPAGWVELIGMLSDPFELDVTAAQALLARLSPRDAGDWRYQQLCERVEMADADAQVRRQTQWNAERLRAAGRFWSAKERLYRRVWRMGLARHIFRFEGSAPTWNAEYQQVLGRRLVEAQAEQLAEA